MAGRYGVHGWEPDPATAFNACHGDGFARQILRDQIEEAHHRHLADERWPEEPHPEGCFFCASFEHHSRRH